MYSIGWSSTCTARCRAFGSSVSTLGHRPAHEHAVDLEPEVVVQTRARWRWTTNLRAPVAFAASGEPAGSGVRSKRRFF